jgi:adenylate kinase
MKKGELVPDEVVIRMVLERIQEPDARGGYILDGFPRTHEQAEALDRALAQEGVRIDEVPLVEVETEELVRRLAGRWICSRCQTPYHQETAPPAKPGECDACGGELYQRPDDRPEAVRRRLEVYEEQTTPLVRYYERQGKLRRVNGQQKIEQVAADLRKALGE